MSWGSQGSISIRAWVYNSSFLLQDLSILILQFSQQWHVLFASCLFSEIKGIIFFSRWQDWKGNLHSFSGFQGLMCKLLFLPTAVMTFCVLEYLGYLDNLIMGKSHSNLFPFQELHSHWNFFMSLAVKESEKERKLRRKQEGQISFLNEEEWNWKIQMIFRSLFTLVNILAIKRKRRIKKKKILQ